MKKNIYILILCFLSINTARGQLDIYLNNMQPGQNYYDIKQDMLDYLDSLKNTMDSATYYGGDGEYKRFKMFERIWESRVEPHGSFDVYFDAVNDFYKNKADDYAFLSTEAWHEIGPNKNQINGSLGIGPVEFLSFYDNGTSDSCHIMLTGSTLGGLFYTTDTANTWHSTATDAWPQSGCSWAVFHPQKYRTWFASSTANGASTEAHWIGQHGGIFKTEDEGQSWEQIADHNDLGGDYTIIYKLLISKENPDLLFAATNYGLFRTLNCDTTEVEWQNVLSGNVYDLEVKPGNDSLMFASVYNSNAGRWQVMSSSQYGNIASWDTIIAQPEHLPDISKRSQHISLEVSKAKPDYLYCLVRNKSHKLYYIDMSIDTAWTYAGNNEVGFGDGHGFGVEQVENGEKIIVSKDIWLKYYNLSTGDSSTLKNIVHVDVEDVVYHPYTADELWICTHGGVEKSIDGGQSWQAKYHGLGVAQVEGIASAYTDPQYVVCGLFHDGTQIGSGDFTPGWSPEWEHRIVGDGMKPLIDNTDPMHMWGALQYGLWGYSSNAMHSFSGIHGSAYWQTVGVLNKQNPEIFYHSSFIDFPKFDEEIIRSFNRGLTDTAFISDFKSFVPAPNRTNILGLYTPYNNGDYLLAYMYDEDTLLSNGERTHYLFRTTNATASNVIWEELIMPTKQRYIADIEFNPTNPDQIYLAYSGSTIQSRSDSMVFKIDYSNPAIPITDDISKNLPVTSISKHGLLVDRNNSGGLFIGTEYGVFYTDDALQQNQGNEWQRVGNGLPHCKIHGLEINYPANILRVGTFGRGMWELPLPCPYNNDPLTISADTSWNTLVYMQRDLIINPGANLTIQAQGEVLFTQAAKLIVKPGAKLVIDGGILTSKCYDLWQGIEVWGNPELSQTPANQGWLSISNGGTIQNAVVAVRMGVSGEANPDGGGLPPIDYKGGGILSSSEGLFRNNRAGVIFHPYSGNNLSNINLSTFETTDKLPYDTAPIDHIRLVSVEGIRISGCIFRSAANIPYSQRGIGIQSFDASFLVDHHCISNNNPCTEYQQTVFDKLYYGIYATASTSLNYADVRNSLFTNTCRGIYLGGMNMPRITSNTFEIPSSSALEAYGLYLDECSEYWVEANDFTGHCHPGWNTCEDIGIVVNESGYEPNEIYRNTFTNVGYSILAQGVNRHPRSGEGLVCKCNTFTENGYDIVVSDYDPSESTDFGIARFQGSPVGQPDAPAGNLFSWTGPEGTYTDINNQGLHISYFYHSSAPQYLQLKPEYYDTLKVNAIPNPFAAWDSTSCPSYIDTPGGGITEEEIRGMLSESKCKSDSIGQLIQALEDAGNTESLEWTVDMSSPEQSYELYNQLMNTTPYISDTVMAAAIQKEEVLPDAMIRDVMVASPESTKNDALLQKLTDRTDPFPEYMLGQILQGRSLVSAYGDLLARQAYHNSRKSYAAQALKRICVSDTTGTLTIDSLIVLLNDEQSIKSQIYLAFIYLNQQDSLAAVNTLAAIPDHYPLDDQQLIEHALLTDYLALLINMQTNNMQADSTQAEYLINMAITGQGLAGTYARNMLLDMELINYSEPIFLPDNTKSAIVHNNPPIKDRGNAQDILSVYPNPATDYIIAKWTFPEQAVQLSLILCTAEGRVMHEININTTEGQEVIDTSNLLPGIYLVSIYDGSKTIKSIKISIN